MTRGILVFLCFGTAAMADSRLPPEAAGRPRPDSLARACEGCHAATGETDSDSMQVPSFNLLPRNQFLELMQQFKTGERRSSIMNRIAKGYQDADFRALADYYELP